MILVRTTTAWSGTRMTTLCTDTLDGTERTTVRNGGLVARTWSIGDAPGGLKCDLIFVYDTNIYSHIVRN